MAALSSSPMMSCPKKMESPLPPRGQEECPPVSDFLFDSEVAAVVVRIPINDAIDIPFLPILDAPTCHLQRTAPVVAESCPSSDFLAVGYLGPSQYTSIAAKQEQQPALPVIAESRQSSDYLAQSLLQDTALAQPPSSTPTSPSIQTGGCSSELFEPLARVDLGNIHVDLPLSASGESVSGCHRSQHESIGAASGIDVTPEDIWAQSTPILESSPRLSAVAALFIPKATRLTSRSETSSQLTATAQVFVPSSLQSRLNPLATEFVSEDLRPSSPSTIESQLSSLAGVFSPTNSLSSGRSTVSSVGSSAESIVYCPPLNAGSCLVNPLYYSGFANTRIDSSRSTESGSEVLPYCNPIPPGSVYTMTFATIYDTPIISPLTDLAMKARQISCQPARDNASERALSWQVSTEGQFEGILDNSSIWYFLYPPSEYYLKSLKSERLHRHRERLALLDEHKASLELSGRKYLKYPGETAVPSRLSQACTTQGDLAEIPSFEPQACGMHSLREKEKYDAFTELLTHLLEVKNIQSTQLQAASSITITPAQARARQHYLSRLAEVEVAIGNESSNGDWADMDEEDDNAANVVQQNTASVVCAQPVDHTNPDMSYDTTDSWADDAIEDAPPAKAPLPQSGATMQMPTNTESHVSATSAQSTTIPGLTLNQVPPVTPGQSLAENPVEEESDDNNHRRVSSTSTLASESTPATSPADSGDEQQQQLDKDDQDDEDIYGAEAGISDGVSPQHDAAETEPENDYVNDCSLEEEYAAVHGTPAPASFFAVSDAMTRYDARAVTPKPTRLSAISEATEDSDADDESEKHGVPASPSKSVGRSSNIHAERLFFVVSASQPRSSSAPTVLQALSQPASRLPSLDILDGVDVAPINPTLQSTRGVRSFSGSLRRKNSVRGPFSLRQRFTADENAIDEIFDNADEVPDQTIDFVELSEESISKMWIALVEREHLTHIARFDEKEQLRTQHADTAGSMAYDATLTEDHSALITAALGQDEITHWLAAISEANNDAGQGSPNENEAPGDKGAKTDPASVGDDDGQGDDQDEDKIDDEEENTDAPAKDKEQENNLPNARVEVYDLDVNWSFTSLLIGAGIAVYMIAAVDPMVPAIVIGGYAWLSRQEHQGRFSGFSRWFR